MLYFQLAFFPVAVVAACWAGLRVAQTQRWWLAVAGPFLVIALLLVGHRWPRAAFVPPVSWTVDADFSPLLMTPAIALLFATLIPRLPRPRRPAVWLIMGIMLLNYGLLPAALPLAARPALGATRTHLDRQGVCRQSHAYSCGPAAAVTCLHQLGIEADEGMLAIGARTGPLVGTNGALLARAVEKRYPRITAHYRFAAAPESLALPAAAEMMMPVIGGHFIAVLAVGRDYVEVGDPISGKARIPREEFARQWTGAAVEFIDVGKVRNE